ncbi:MAG: 7-carboxy-7-deazaguanine synthase QueE [Bacteroidia bacterium]|nr:7-carboxy-7-deazaguanine synthase QueE [Bacteroidia bacterium]
MIEQEVKDIFQNGRLLPVIEEFYTIQGEGFHSGRPAYFIRVGGCDIGCSWCDTKYSWTYNVHRLADVRDIIEKANNTPARAVVVTGGEPSQYPLDYLTSGLKSNGIATFIETSGAFPLTGIWDWICLSPKMQNPPLREYFSKASELKVIIQNYEDILWAEENAAKVNELCRLYLQPEWSKLRAILPSIVEYVKLHPSWSISMQAHKFMNIP